MICTGPRVGIRAATERPWRFWLPDEPSVSAFRPGVARAATPRRGKLTPVTDDPTNDLTCRPTSSTPTRCSPPARRRSCRPTGWPSGWLAARREDRPLRVKLGIDPSGSDLTLGHAVVLRKLRQFQDFGHTAVLVVGGFTGQVGDPSGRTATRVAQSADQVIENAKGYFDQLMRILDPDRVEVVNNADWLGTMQVAEMLGYTRQITVAQLLERDDFARRFAAQQPITLSEFFYPLLQGIDSVEIRADIELGGTDQTFNNLVGRRVAERLRPGAAGRADRAAARRHRRRREDGQVARQLHRDRRAGRPSSSAS